MLLSRRLTCITCNMSKFYETGRLIDREYDDDDDIADVAGTGIAAATPFSCKLEWLLLLV